MSGLTESPPGASFTTSSAENSMKSESSSSSGSPGNATSPSERSKDSNMELPTAGGIESESSLSPVSRVSSSMSSSSAGSMVDRSLASGPWRMSFSRPTL